MQVSGSPGAPGGHGTSCTSVAGTIDGAAPQTWFATPAAAAVAWARGDVVRIVERERQRARERGGIGGVLRLTPAHQQRAVVDRERAERDQRQHRDRDVHEDCPALIARQRSSNRSSSKSPPARQWLLAAAGRDFGFSVASGAGRNRVGCVGSGGTSSGLSGRTSRGVTSTISSVRSRRSALLLNR